MDPKVKNRWVKALRSGEYKQGRFRLKRAGKHCCLGVLCEIQGKPDGDGWSGWRAFPPVGMRFGILDVEMKKLVTLNDDGATFAQIADWIEVNL